MATAKWATPSAQGSDIAGTTLNSIANGATSAFITYDNSSNLDLYAAVEITLGAQGGNRTTGSSVTLRGYSVAGATPTDTGSVGGGETYTVTTDSGVSTAWTGTVIVRLTPFSMRWQVTQNTGQTTGASGNSIKFRPFNEAIA